MEYRSRINGRSLKKERKNIYIYISNSNVAISCMNGYLSLVIIIYVKRYNHESPYSIKSWWEDALRESIF